MSPVTIDRTILALAATKVTLNGATDDNDNVYNNFVVQMVDRMFTKAIEPYESDIIAYALNSVVDQELDLRPPSDGEPFANICKLLFAVITVQAVVGPLKPDVLSEHKDTIQRAAMVVCFFLDVGRNPGDRPVSAMLLHDVVMDIAYQTQDALEQWLETGGEGRATDLIAHAASVFFEQAAFEYRPKRQPGSRGIVANLDYIK